MWQYPEINPIAFSIGDVQFHWYGMMYVIGFLAFLILGRWRTADSKYGVDRDHVGDIMFYGVLGTILGGRLGYLLFYNFDRLVADWTLLFRIWEGGMSFHGGLIGVLVALWIFASLRNYRFLQLTDFAAPLVPIGLAFGRLGNFINGELWGRPTDGPWSMVFPHVDDLPRHPSQLYEMMLEGVLLFVILWAYSSKQRGMGAVSGLFAVGYSSARFLVEFTREPDAHIGFVLWGWMTLGQLLCVPLLILGLFLLYRASSQQSRVIR